jgi:hypothetical protein
MEIEQLSRHLVQGTHFYVAALWRFALLQNRLPLAPVPQVDDSLFVTASRTTNVAASLQSTKNEAGRQVIETAQFRFGRIDLFEIDSAYFHYNKALYSEMENQHLLHHFEQFDFHQLKVYKLSNLARLLCCCQNIPTWLMITLRLRFSRC